MDEVVLTPFGIVVEADTLGRIDDGVWLTLMDVLVGE